LGATTIQLTRRIQQGERFEPTAARLRLARPSTFHGQCLRKVRKTHEALILFELQSHVFSQSTISKKTKTESSGNIDRASALAKDVHHSTCTPRTLWPSHFFWTIPIHFKALNQNETRISNRDQPKVKNRFRKSNFNLELEK